MNEFVLTWHDGVEALARWRLHFGSAADSRITAYDESSYVCIIPHDDYSEFVLRFCLNQVLRVPFDVFEVGTDVIIPCYYCGSLTGCEHCPDNGKGER